MMPNELAQYTKYLLVISTIQEHNNTFPLEHCNRFIHILYYPARFFSPIVEQLEQAIVSTYLPLIKMISKSEDNVIFIAAIWHKFHLSLVAYRDYKALTISHSSEIQDFNKDLL